jgi:DNA polymerase-3 subunit gamma/tau
MENSNQEFIVTARKWRPQRFNDVVGQDHISTTLINAIKNKRLHHAYLFSGPRGVGKTTTARILARAINCANLTGSEPCNVCDSCIHILEGRSLDVIEIDGASNNSVDDIRKLIDNSKYPPSLGKYKLYIIDEVHMLSTSAFNALLKTLEEPPPHLMFVFATTEVHKLPPTILSRCQRFEFRRMEINDIISQLKFIADKEKIEIDEESLITIAKKADGSMRDSQSIFDQVVAFCGNNVKYSEMADALHLIDEDFYFRVSDAVVNNNVEEMFSIVKDVLDKGYDLQECLNGILEHFRNILTFKVTNGSNYVNTSSFYKDKYISTSNHFNQNDLIRIMNIIALAESSIRFAFQPRVKFELTLSQIATLDKTTDIENLLNELNELKKNSNLLGSQKENEVQNNSVAKDTNIEYNKPVYIPKAPVINTKIKEDIKQPVIETNNDKSDLLETPKEIKVFDPIKQINSFELSAGWNEFVNNFLKPENGFYYLKGSMVETEFTNGDIIIKTKNDLTYKDLIARRDVLVDLLKNYYLCNLSIIILESEKKEITREKFHGDDILTADFDLNKKEIKEQPIKKIQNLEDMHPTEIAIIDLFKAIEIN